MTAETLMQMENRYETEKPPATSYFIKLRRKEQKKMKVLVLDSGVLINLSMNGLLDLFEKLKKISEVRFAITEDVKYETVDRPINVPRFELGAMRVKYLIENKIIEMPENFGIRKSEIDKRKNELMKIANSSVRANGKFVNIVSNAEMSCLALSSILTEKGIENIIGIDERTTRLLAEKPENLEEMMSSRLHQKIELVKKNFSAFEKFSFVRSAEIVYVAYKKGILNLNHKTLEALLYATKYKGSSISFEEIDELKRL